MSKPTKEQAKPGPGATFIAILIVGLLIFFVVKGCSGSSSAGADCPKAVDALSAELARVQNASDISASVAKDSFSGCGGPASWTLAADTDKIGTQIGNLGDMDGTPLSSDDALAFLCARYDRSNSTDTCAGR